MSDTRPVFLGFIIPTHFLILGGSQAFSEGTQVELPEASLPSTTNEHIVTLSITTGVDVES